MEDRNNTSYLHSLEAAAANATGDTYQFYQVEQLVFLCVLFVLILVGNTLVLLAIAMSDKRKSRMNFFIINLACADLSVGLLLVLTDIIWKATIEWYAGNVGCKLIKFAQCYATYGATYALVALSIDRFDAIARPLSIANVGRRCRILVTVAWACAGLFSLPMLYMYEAKTVDGIPQCWMELQEPWMWRLYLTLVSLAVFVFPAICIATCYIVIVVVIWRSSSLNLSERGSKRGQNDQGRAYNMNQNGAVPLRPAHKTVSTSSSRGVIPRAKIKTIKMTFVIVLAFICCWSPYFIWDLLSVYDHIPVSQQTIAVSTFIQSLAPLNSAANPIIYTLFNTAVCGAVFRKRGDNPHNFNTKALV